MFQMSSAQAASFAEAAREMTEQVVALGPNPLRKENPQPPITPSSPQPKEETEL